MKLLLIDDEVACGEKTINAVQHDYPDAEVKQVLDCLAGMKELCETGGYDAAIVDINGGGINGVQCVREIRDHWKSLPVVVLTGTWNDEIRRVVLDAGADDYVAKAVMEQILSPTLVSAIERRKGSLQAEYDTCRRRTQLETMRNKLPA